MWLARPSAIGRQPTAPGPSAQLGLACGRLEGKQACMASWATMKQAGVEAALRISTARAGKAQG